MRSIRVGAIAGALLALGGALSGCGGSGGTIDSPASRLVATWKLVKTSGGIMGNGQNPTPNERLTFLSNGTFQRTVEGVSSSGAYTVLERPTIFSATDEPVITYTPSTLPDVITVVDEAHLVVNQEATDGFTREYEKVAL